MSQMATVESMGQFTDPRIQAVIDHGHFFVPYRDEIEELFTALGRSDSYSDDPRDLLGYIEPGWIGREHGNATTKDQFTLAQEQAAMPVLRDMGLVTELLPPPRLHADQLLELGATLPTSIQRAGLTHIAITQFGVTADTIIRLDGQRPREARDGTNEDILHASGHDVTENPWVRHTMNRGEWDSDNPWGLTEAALGRVTVLKTWGGDLRPHRINLDVTDLRNPHQLVRPTLPGIPPRLVESYEYTTPGGQNIIVMNAPAVVREQGPPRHTTESAAEAWLINHAPPEDADVLFVSSNPHTIRTAMKVKKVLRDHGREDVRLSVAGSAAKPYQPVQLFLGEVAALIAFDVKQNYQSK